MTAIEAPRAPTSPPDRLGPVVDLRAPPGAVGPGRQPSRAGVLVVLPALVTFLALWSILFAAVLTGLQERSTQNHLYEQFRLQLANETAPLAEPIPTGRPVAMISAPTDHISNVVVVEGTTSRLLKGGPGHLSDTPLPGQAGDSVIFGRSVTYGRPFGSIVSMRPGETLVVTTGQGAFKYAVEDVRGSGAPLPAALKDGQSRITLVTSTGGNWMTAWVPIRTVYVDARLVGKAAQPVPTGVPSSVSPASLPMKGDPTGTVALIFWIEALAVASAGAVWCWKRWGRREAWLAAAPVVLAALWGTSDAVMRFLPNLV